MIRGDIMIREKRKGAGCSDGVFFCPSRVAFKVPDYGGWYE